MVLTSKGLVSSCCRAGELLAALSAVLKLAKPRLLLAVLSSLPKGDLAAQLQA